MAAPGQAPVPTEPAHRPTPPPGPDWTVQAADTIESVVATIRTKSTVPLETVARALVYGVILAVMGITALVLVIVALVRLLEVALPVGDVWLPYMSAGILFTTLGLLLWSKRRPQPDSGKGGRRR